MNIVEVLEPLKNRFAVTHDGLDGIVFASGRKKHYYIRRFNGVIERFVFCFDDACYDWRIVSKYEKEQR